MNCRDEFIAELDQHRTAEGLDVIKATRNIHGMGGVGKPRAAITWKHADDYRALLFPSADSEVEQSTSTLQFAT